LDYHTFHEKSKQLVLRVIRLVETLPPGLATQEIGRQLLQAVIRTGFMLRSLPRIRIKSPSELEQQLHEIEVNFDECLYLLGLLVEANLTAEDRVKDMLEEVMNLLTTATSLLKQLHRHEL
jgi:hypothetical protein